MNMKKFVVVMFWVMSIIAGFVLGNGLVEFMTATDKFEATKAVMDAIAGLMVTGSGFVIGGVLYWCGKTLETEENEEA